MLASIDTLVVLNDPTVRQVLRILARKKSSRMNELMNAGLSGEAVMRALHSMKEQDLIKESPSSIKELATYYITAEGLRAERELKGFG